MYTINKCVVFYYILRSYLITKNSYPVKLAVASKSAKRKKMTKQSKDSTPLLRLLDAHYEEFSSGMCTTSAFQKRYGYWRAVTDEVV